MRPIFTASRERFEAARPAFAYALISFRDPELPPVSAPGVVRRLDLTLYDWSQNSRSLPGPQREHAVEICKFVAELPPDLSLIVQCEAGIGRSAATAAALLRGQGDARHREFLRSGSYNRRLYQLICAELGLALEAEPLVALAVRIKYPLDRAMALVASLQRQRYDNWRCFLVLDGPQDHPVALEPADKVSWIETPVRRGLWGHPYRQLGIDQCLGAGAAYIGINNDDNYLTPGYLEQMVGALREHDADLVLCQTLHAYCAWQVVPSEPRIGNADVGNWLAAANLIRQVTFDETDFAADGRFVERLAMKARRVARVDRPLFVKN